MFRVSLSRFRAPFTGALVLALATGALAQQPAPSAAPPSPKAAPLPQKVLPKRGAIPGNDLTEITLYELLLAEIALQRGEVGLAAQTYLQLAKRTLDPRVARRAAEVATAAKMPEIAIEAAKVWQTVEPSPQALLTLSSMLVAAKRVDEAEPFLQRLLTLEGVNVEVGFLQLGRMLAANPDKAANLRLVRSLAGQHPRLPAAHFAVAQAALAANEDPLALVAIREALSLRPDWELAAIFEAQVLQKRSSSEAAKSLEGFLARYPAAREARLNYARALVQDKRAPEARKQLETLVAMNAGNPEVLYTVGLLAFQLKDFAFAEESMQRLLELQQQRDPNSVRYILGQIAEERKQWERAMEWYKQIDEGEHALPARMRTAGAIAKQGRIDEAREYLKRIEPAGPGEQVQLLVAEAQLLREANRHRDAYDVLGQALQKSPDQPELLYDYALTAEKLERYDVAEQNLRKLIQVKPDHAHAYNALGYSLADRNQRLPEARKLIEKALELAPEDFFIIDSLGWVLYRQGDLRGALRELRRAYAGRPDAEIGAHLGEVLWVTGERAEAERIWKEALESSPDNETLQKTIQRLKR